MSQPDPVQQKITALRERISRGRHQADERLDHLRSIPDRSTPTFPSIDKERIDAILASMKPSQSSEKPSLTVSGIIPGATPAGAPRPRTPVVS